MNKADRNNLKKRYLIWFYKVTKEELDKIERKFTQLEVDKIVYKKSKALLNLKNSRQKRLLKGFEAYIAAKQKDALILKFGRPNSKILRAEYVFLKAKLDSIEAAIKKIFGISGLKQIKNLYEQEMTARILHSTAH